MGIAERNIERNIDAERRSADCVFYLIARRTRETACAAGKPARAALPALPTVA